MTSNGLWNATKRARRGVDALSFGPPVAHVYNPLDYAAAPHRELVERFGAGPKKVILLGMNPGPFGMVQTGVPFGEVAIVRDWIGIDAKVRKPADEHPERPIDGFDCKRSEVSGRRLWGLFRERFGTPERFFRDHWVHNYCPLAFLEDSGRNRTPDKLPAAEREPLFEVCDDFLRRVVDLLEPEVAVGIGAFAEQCLRRVLAHRPHAPRIGRIPHPSPASPLANRGWDEPAVAALGELGIELPPARRTRR